MSKNTLIIALIAVLLLGAGGGYGIYKWRDGRPAKQGYPILSLDKIEAVKWNEIRDAVDTTVKSDEILKATVTKYRLAQQWELDNDEAASEELKTRITIRIDRTKPWIELLVKGKLGEVHLLKSISDELRIQTCEKLNIPYKEK